MRKEVLIAIAIGFVLGLVITFGIWTANRALQKATVQGPTPTPAEEEPTATPTPSFTLKVTSPKDNTISSQESIKITGETGPEATVVILYPEGEKILEADEEGKFSTEITLRGGENLATISAYSQEGNEVSQTLTIVYSTAKI